MKLNNPGRTLLAAAVSLALAWGLSSCNSFTTGFLFVAGVAQNQQGGNSNGTITAYKIEHNTGRLTATPNKSVYASGGTNPAAILSLPGRRYVYVLNSGINGQQGNISLFSFGGQGNLTQLATYPALGTYSQRMAMDAAGKYLLVEDQQAPVGGAAGITNCPGVGEITVYQIDPVTGRLTLVANAQAKDANTGAALSYFCVGPSPIDLIFGNAGTVFSLNGDADHGIFTYSFDGTSGQLTANPHGTQASGAVSPTAFAPAPAGIFILDNSPIGGSPSGFRPFSVATDGALQALAPVANTPTTSDPVAALLEVRSQKFFYVANADSSGSGDQTNPQSIISAFNVDDKNGLTTLSGQPFTVGSGPQCIVEDPSNQYVFTANNDKTVTARRLVQNSGQLEPLRVTTSYALSGPATACAASHVIQ